LAAALMCSAMALPAAAAGVGASANGTAGIDTRASGSIGAPSTTAGVNGGINAQTPAPEQSAMNANGNMAADAQPDGQASAQADDQSSVQAAQNQPEEAGAQTGLKDDGSASQSSSGKLAMNESAFRDVGGDTSTKYRAKTRSADFDKEAQVTAQLNQEAAKMAAPGSN
jgi:hypothetical protein